MEESLCVVCSGKPQPPGRDTCQPCVTRAHRAVKLAVSAGRLTPIACECCDDPKSEAHHDDYSRMLDVLWLCRKCHMARHETVRGGAVRATPPTSLSQSRRNRSLRKRRRAAGLCTRCGKSSAREARTTCEGCNANSVAAMQASRKRLATEEPVDADAVTFEPGSLERALEEILG